MARKTRSDAGIPPAPPIGGARTFAQMEELARQHAGTTAAEPIEPAAEPSAALAALAAPAAPAALEPVEQEASIDV